MTASYDYIIVGAGSAGCVLANRLSADPNIRVLLLEAGGWDWNPLIHIPIGVGKLVRSTLHGWGYWTEPEKHLDGRARYWPRGKVVGGSSAINSMIYIRGHRSDYDHWAQLGNRGWSYDDILPYFLKSEGHEDRTGDLHSADGPLGVSRGSSDNPVYDAFMSAGVEAGMKRNDDFNGSEQDGVGRYDFTIRNGRRASSATCYLNPVKSRPNLTIAVRAHATKILIERGKAKGLNYVENGVATSARAEREVILSGGSINSPQLLMLSGVGPGDHLREHGIDVNVDAAGVGQNLQDHYDVPIMHACPEPVTLYSLTRWDKAASMMIQAALFKNGPATSFPAEGGAFVRTRPELEAPDMQWHLLLGLEARRIRWPWEGLMKQGPLDREGFALRMCQLRPESRGQLTLKSADPFESIRIDANYLTSETDVRTMRDGVKLGREVLAQSALDKYRGVEIAPGPDVQTDDEIDAWVKKIGETIYHPTGTVKMGPDNDAMAVVDDQLRVKGVEGLRVVDASIFPTLIGGNTNGPVMAIAEKASEMILGQA